LFRTSSAYKEGENILMKVGEDAEKNREEIIEAMKCRKNFKCYKPGVEELPRIRVFEDEKLIECFEKNAQDCEFSFRFGNAYFCNCSLIKQISKDMKIKSKD